MKFVGLQDLIKKTYSQFIDILNKLPTTDITTIKIRLSARKKKAWKNNVSSPDLQQGKGQESCSGKKKGKVPSEIVNPLHYSIIL